MNIVKVRVVFALLCSLFLTSFAPDSIAKDNSLPPQVRAVKFPPNLLLEPKISKQLQKPYQATISILTSAGRITGSGVVLRHRKDQHLLILSAYHIVEAAEQTENPQLYAGVVLTNWITPIHVLKTDDKLDLVIFESIGFCDEDGPEAVISPEDPAIGDQVWLIGNPVANERNISRGILSGVDVDENGRLQYRTDAAVFFGNSGGGAYDKDGSLIGIVIGMTVIQAPWGAPTVVPGDGLIVHRYHILQFLTHED